MMVGHQVPHWVVLARNTIVEHPLSLPPMLYCSHLVDPRIIRIQLLRFHESLVHPVDVSLATHCFK